MRKPVLLACIMSSSIAIIFIVCYFSTISSIISPLRPLRVHNLNTNLSYRTIQEAIDAPQTREGHVISVDEGTYHENVVIDKSLSLIGENRSTTIIEGEGQDSDGLKLVMEIKANGVSISGFTVRQLGNGGAKACIHAGSMEQKVHGFKISGNIIEGYLKFWYDEHGVMTIDGNTGIYVAFSEGEVSDNDINNCSTGVFWWWSLGGNIRSNTIRNCFEGIKICYSNNNLVCHNNFIVNENQVYSYDSINVWDDGYPSGGNYWNDYMGADSNADGIGDIPYIIDADNQDRYPLVETRIVS